MTVEPHELQQDPPEGFPGVTEREIALQPCVRPGS